MVRIRIPFIRRETPAIFLICIVCLVPAVIFPVYAPGLSNLAVTSEPTGAYLYYYTINPASGNPEGGIYFGTTPKTIVDIPDGTKVRLEFYKDGYMQKSLDLTTGPATPSTSARLVPVAQDFLVHNTGYLLVTSNPTGGEVTINQGSSGKTPLAKALPAGEYAVDISYGGYLTTRKTANLGEGKTVMINANLERGAAVNIFSSPDGAKIILDGVDSGKTPKTLPTVKAGDHVIELRLDGYESSVTRLSLAQGDIKTVDVVLKKTGASSLEPGTLSVTSTPSGATVFLLGKSIGKTPLTYRADNRGEGTLLVQLAGYQDMEVPYSFMNSQTPQVSVTLLPVSAQAGGVLVTTGTLSVTSSPSNAGVYENGVLIGSTPLTITGVDTGPRTILIALDGYEDYTGTVTVPPGGTGSLNAVLAPVTPSQGGAAPPSTGTLSVTSDPSSAGVYENGVLLGPTPLTRAGYSPGVHTLTLAADGYGDYVTTVTIVAGQTTPVYAALTRETAPASSQVPTTGAVLVRSLPSAAIAMIDGKVGRTTPASYPQVPAGAHTITVTRDGYALWQSEVNIRAGSTSTINAVLQSEKGAGAAASPTTSIPAPTRTRRLPLAAILPVIAFITGSGVVWMTKKR